MMIRPTYGHWAVFKQIDAYHAKTLFEGTKDECEAFVKACELKKKIDAHYAQKGSRITLNNLLIELYTDMNRSPLDVQLSIMKKTKMFFGTSHDEHIRRLIIEQPYVKRYAVYNDESEIMIELEG